MMPDRWDVMAITGVLLVAAGLWMIYPPVAIIVTGILLLAVSWIGAQRSSGE
jgi:hypothetical protein